MQDTKTRAAPGLLAPARDNIYHCGSHVIFQDAYSKCFESIAIRFKKIGEIKVVLLWEEEKQEKTENSNLWVKFWVFVIVFKTPM